MVQTFVDIPQTDLLSVSRQKILDRDEAVRTCFLGANEPTVMAAGQFWIDSTATKMKVRNEANTDWYIIGNFAAELGHLPLAGGTMTGALNMGNQAMSALASLVFNAGGATVTEVKDEDNMVSDSPTVLATQQSIKAYADALPHGVVTKVIDHTWEGDDGDDKEVDLGDDYDFILIFLEESRDANTDHFVMAYAFKNVYGAFSEEGPALNHTSHKSMASTNNYFQGKMTGGDADKIKLGAVGADQRGANYTGWTYRLIGFKFSSME